MVNSDGKLQALFLKIGYSGWKILGDCDCEKGDDVGLRGTPLTVAFLTNR
jgi:hypothetical protein